jgi:hypothetical protein
MACTARRRCHSDGVPADADGCRQRRNDMLPDVPMMISSSAEQQNEECTRMTQGIEGARRLLETTDPDTVNQYLRFGWKLINQYLVPATADSPGRVKYVLAAIRTVEETKELVTLRTSDEVNEYLALGWTLIDKFVKAAISERRDEEIQFIVAWQAEGLAVKPGSPAAEAVSKLAEQLSGEIELEAEA